jgi:hypothetical protein
MLTKLSENNKLEKSVSATGWLIFGLLVLAAFCPPAYEQEATPVAGKYVAQARNILRALYPELDDKGYALSIATPINYDRPDESSQYFELNVGDRFKDIILGYIGGYQGEKPKDYKPGPIHPKQYLTGIFTYQGGHLKSFDVSGSVVGNPDAILALREQIAVPKPGVTAAKANPALKQAGAKYGLEDKAAFVAALPLARLEPFVGKLSITSVKMEGSDEDDDDVRASSWPNWTVLATAQQADRQVPVRMAFEPFKGDLISLIVDPGQQ